MCELGWAKKSGLCYKLVNQTGDYNAAAAGCKLLGADLAAPKTSTIMTALNSLNLDNFEFWIGLDDE